LEDGLGKPKGDSAWKKKAERRGEGETKKGNRVGEGRGSLERCLERELCSLREFFATKNENEEEGGGEKASVGLFSQD